MARQPNREDLALLAALLGQGAPPRERTEVFMPCSAAQLAPKCPRCRYPESRCLCGGFEALQIAYTIDAIYAPPDVVKAALGIIAENKGEALRGSTELQPLFDYEPMSRPDEEK